jgi:serine/threonine-protein kinase
MRLSSGSRLGPYEIVSLLGVGGMGEVYRARDTRLDRDVAVKVLSAAHSAAPGFRSRFEREARTVAALSHPHICTVHDVGHDAGTDYLVMELIEGTTLAARLDEELLPLSQALEYGIQIADALERAHRAGVVHRDLKPGNVMVTKAGVKLVDFGLAKNARPALAEIAVASTSPAEVTAAGTILGTLQYMAPEQIEGADADPRTDIFSLGTVLYEMVTGRKAFEGKTPASVIGAILRDQPPPVAAHLPHAPRTLDRVIATCLAKDPADRWQSARDLRRELQWVADELADPVASSRLAVPDRRGLRPWLAAVLVGTGLLAGIAMGWAGRSAPAPGAVARWTFPVAPIGNTARVAISQDAETIVYDGTRADGVQQVYVKRRDQLEPAPVRGTDGVTQLTLSPDGAWVLFVAGSHLLKVPLAGGAVAAVCDVPRNVLGLSWGAGDQIVFGSTEGLHHVPASGGEAILLTRVDPGAKESAHGWPVLLADGRTILFAISRAAVPEIAVTSLAGEASRTLTRGTHPRVTAAGDLLFSRGGTVWATRANADFSRLMREPVPVLESVTSLLSGYAAFDVAANGTLVYRPRRPESHQLSWVEPTGRVSAAVNERFDGIYHGPPALSPNGRRLAVSRHPTNGVDQIVIYDLERGIQTLLTGVSGTSRWPVWTPDGTRLTFASEREGSWDVFEVPANGAGEPQPLLVAPHQQVPWSWSPDGETLAYISGEVAVFDIWFLRRGGEPVALPPPTGGRGPRISASVAFSSDGKWIVYHSDESGRIEVYLRPYPGPGDPIQVSTDGGRYPTWSRDGQAILYSTADNRVMSVAVRLTSEPVLSQPTELFRLQFGNDGARPYDVAADGRLIAIQDLNTTPASIVVVEHWTQELARLLAAP